MCFHLKVADLLDEDNISIGVSDVDLSQLEEQVEEKKAPEPKKEDADIKSVKSSIPIEQSSKQSQDDDLLENTRRRIAGKSLLKKSSQEEIVESQAGPKKYIIQKSRADEIIDI
jgi:hypothetical protein